MKKGIVWMPHPGHFICADSCRFHLNTYVNGWIVSTVGEYWPDRQVREIHAHVYDPDWLRENVNLKGDFFDAAYMKRFGFVTLGHKRTYETMVFRAKASGQDCCPYVIVDGDTVDFRGYDDAGKAFGGHNQLVYKYSVMGPPCSSSAKAA